MATPLLRALGAIWPQAEIDWMVGEHSRAVLIGHPNLNTLFSSEPYKPGQVQPWAVWRLGMRLRQAGYDAVFVPDRSPVLALLARLSAAPLRVGLNVGWRGRLYTHRVHPFRGRILDREVSESEEGASVHESRLYLDLLSSLGLAIGSELLEDLRPSFHPGQDDVRAAEAFLQSEMPEERRPIAIHPAGGENPGMQLHSKRWPAGHYARLITRIVEKWNRPVVLLGSAADRPLLESLMQQLSPQVRSRVHSAGGQLNLGAVAALIAESHVYVGNDSGIAHLASAVGTPVLAIFGPTDPGRYGPVPGAGLAVSPNSTFFAPSVESTRSAGEASLRPVERDLNAMQDSKAIESISVDAIWDGLKALVEERA